MGLFLYKYRKEFHGLILLLIGLFITTSFILTTKATGSPYQPIDALGQVQANLNNFPFVSKFGTGGSSNGELSSPGEISFDSSGYIYVADAGNNRIEKFNPSGGYDSQFGTAGTGDGELSAPQGLAFDSSGNIYVADTGNNRIEKFDATGAFVNVSGFGVIDGTSVYQTCTANCQAGIAGGGNGQFYFPADVAFDSAGNMYVADELNNRVEKFDPTGAYNSSIDDIDDGGFSPYSITLDSLDNMYVVDMGNVRVEKLNPSGGYDSTIGAGIANSPIFVATDSLDNIYVTDFDNTVKKFDPSGTFIDQFGAGGSSNGKFSSPAGIIVDSLNNIYVSDTGNNRIQKFSQTPAYTFSYPNSLSDGDINSGGGATANSVGFNTAGVGYGTTAVDDVNHRLFVTDPNNNRVLVFNLDSVNLPVNNLAGHTAAIVLGQPGMESSDPGTSINTMNHPVGLAYDSDHDRLFVADQNNMRVLVFDGGNLSDGVDASSVLGEPDFDTVNTGNTISDSQIGTVNQIAYDDIHDRLFVTDFTTAGIGGAASRILVYNTSALSPTGNVAEDVIGAPDFTSGAQDLTATSLNRFAYPTGVTYDPDGDRIFVSDNSLGIGGAGTRILAFDTSALTPTGDPNAVATIDSGSDDFTSLFYSTNPLGQPNNRLFAFNTENNRVLIFDALSLSSTPVAVLGQADFTDTSSGVDNGQLLAPTGGSMDSSNSNLVYVLDSGNNRVMIFPMPTMDAGSINSGAVNSAYSQQVSAKTIPDTTNSYELISGSLPPGLSFDTVTGIISGTPTLAGDYTFAIRAIGTFGTDNFNFVSAWEQFDLKVDPDGQPPEIGNVHVIPGSTTATITWDTINEASSSYVGYGTAGPYTYSVTTSEIDTSPRVTSHTVILTGLTPATLYHFQVNSKDASLNLAQSLDGTFTTTNPPDTTAPTISSVTSSKVNGIYTIGEVIVIQVTFSENVTSTGSVTVTLETGATDRTCTFTISNNTTASCNYTVQTGDTSLDLDTASISGTIKDQALNPMTNFTPAVTLATNKNIVIDTTPPTVSITAPSNGATVSGTVALSGTASDNVAVAQVNFYYGTTLIGTDTTGTPGYGVSWNTNALNNGSYVLKAKAYDTAGNTTDSTTITITVANSGFYDASDLLGQFDATHISGTTYTYSSTPNFTTSNINSNGDGTPAVNNIGMNTPEGTGIDPVNHHLFVSDYPNSRVLVFNLDSSNQLIDNQADYVLGEADMNSYSGGSGNDQLYYPLGIAVDSTHDRLYVVDSGNSRVMVFDISSGGQTMCGGVVSSGLATGMDASCILGQSGSPTVQNSFTPDGGIAIDETNNILYVSADTYRVLAFDVGSVSRTLCTVSTNGLESGMDASCVLGETNFGFGDYFSFAGALNNPLGLAIDSSNHRLYVADQWDARVSIFDTTILSSGEDAVHVLGAADFSGTSSAQDGTLLGPASVALDSVHDLVYVTDNSRILVFNSDPATLTDGESARAILGQPNFATSFSGTTINEMSLSGLLDQTVYDAENNYLYVADSNNNRILIYYFITLPDTVTETLPPTTGTAYSGSVAASYSQGAVTYALVSGSLPAGLTLNTSTGDITGTPTAIGTSNFTIKATDTISLSSFFDEKSYSITVTTSPPPATCPDHSAINFNGPLPCRYGGGVGGGYAQCANSTDDDGDGLVDTLDPGCHSDGDASNASSYVATDTSEADVYVPVCPNLPGWSNSIPHPTVPPPHTYKNSYGQCVNTECSDNVDNDGDGLADTLDPGCHNDGNASNSASYNPDDRIENDSAVPPTTYCSDSTALNYQNTTGDTCIYCDNLTAPNYHNDRGEACTFNRASFQCSDGVNNNDGDTLIDSADPGCHSDGDASNSASYVPLDDSEYDVVQTLPQCSDGQDNDGDHLIDYPNDPGCRGVADNDETDPVQDYCATHQSDPTCTAVLGQFIPNIGNIIHSPYGDPISKAIAITGLLIGAVASIAALFFSTPFTIAELFLLPMRLWSLLLVAFGLKKRVRPWGTVYDAVTKQPLDPVYLELIDKDSKQVATAITDLDGRYGFLVPPGYYMLRPKKTNYIFPSVLLGHVTRDEVYLDLYFGNYFEIKRDNEVITKNIPMDPEGFDWNEFAKHEQKLMKFYSKRTLWLTKISDIAFSIGFLVSLIAFLSNPVLYNILIFSLYILLLILKEAGVSLGKLGTIVNKKTGKPLSYAIIHVYSAALGNEVIKKITTEYGQFYLLIPNGTYHVSIEKKNADGTYNEAYRTTKPIQVKKGIIKGMWEV